MCSRRGDRRRATPSLAAARTGRYRRQAIVAVLAAVIDDYLRLNVYE